MGEGVDKGECYREDAETERDAGDEPAGTDPFAANVRRDFEDDIGDVKDGEEGVVVVALETEVIFESCETCVTLEEKRSVMWHSRMLGLIGGGDVQYWPTKKVLVIQIYSNLSWVM